jgi:hypothetical protein
MVVKAGLGMFEREEPPGIGRGLFYFLDLFYHIDGGNHANYFWGLCVGDKGFAFIFEEPGA